MLGPPVPEAELYDLDAPPSTIPPRATLFLYDIVEEATSRNRPARSELGRAPIECSPEAHIGEGNVVEARRAFVRYRELARRELGVEPSAACQRWIRSVSC